MKRSSMFRRTAVDHAALIADTYADNGLAAPSLPAVGPSPYIDSCTAYMWDLTRMKRMIGALASAVEAGAEAIEPIAEAVREALQPYHIWELPIDGVIRSQANRACRYVPDGELSTHRERVVDGVTRLLAERIREIIEAIDRQQRSLSAGTLLTDGAPSGNSCSRNGCTRLLGCWLGVDPPSTAALS